ATIILSQIIPINKGVNGYVQHLNSLILKLVAELDSSRSRVLLADMYSGFDRGWLYDKVHPDARGEQWIASNFLDLIPNVIHNPTPGPAAMGLGLLGWATVRRQRLR